MKKLIALTAVVALAGIASAASYNWTVQTGYVFKGTGAGGTANCVDSVSAYLFDAGTYSQTAAMTAFLAGGTIDTAKALDTQTISSGRIAAGTAFSYSPTEAYTAYFAVLIGDNIYISTTATGTYTTLDATETITFGNQSSSSGLLPTELASISTYSGGAGLYTAVPEPTSSLLMLLGMAGLALKRKRA